MSLINCPDCNSVVSNKAFQCPTCAYPISYYEEKKNIIPPNKPNSNIAVYPPLHQQQNVQIVSVVEMKSEGTAFLLAFLFGPLGLIYADSKKAAILIGVYFSTLIVIGAITGFSEGIFQPLSYLGAFICWLLSLIFCSEGVRRYNNQNRLLNQADISNGIQNNEAEKINSSLHELNILIEKEKARSSFDTSYCRQIIELLQKLCATKEDAISIVNQYQMIYRKDLISELVSLSTSYMSIYENVETFVEVGVVDKRFPHHRI